MSVTITSLGRGGRLGLKPAGNRYARSMRAEPRQPRLPWKGIGLVCKYAALAAVCFGFFTAVSLALFSGYSWLTRSTLFELRVIEVNGAHYMEYDEVLAASGLEPGKNSLSIKMREVEHGLRRNPWVAAASVRRELPNKISITLEERAPSFWRREGENVYFADGRGATIAPLNSRTFTALPLLEVDEGAEDLLPVFQSFRSRAKGMGLPFIPEDAAWVRLRSDRSMEMYFESRDLLVALDARNWELNLDCLRRAWADLARRGEHGSVRELTAAGAKVWVGREQGKKA